MASSRSGGAGLRRIKHLDLYSGIGGFALAAQWAGIETVAFAEIDPHASKVLTKNFPDVPNLGDVRRLSISRFAFAHAIPDIITAGFPCQPYSKIGKRLANSDDRDLWPETRRIIREFKPTWFLGENVAGIVSLALDGIWTDLEDLGYEVQPLLIPAGAVGARHRRERVWILSHRISAGLEGHAGHEPLASQRRQGPRGSARSSGLRAWFDGWVTEPDVGRVAHGIPARVDRLTALGNAIVPQVAYEILAAITQLQTSE